MTSDWEARQDEQVLDGLGAMGAAHMQHKIVAAVLPATAPPPVMPGAWVVSTHTSIVVEFELRFGFCSSVSNEVVEIMVVFVLSDFGGVEQA